MSALAAWRGHQVDPTEEEKQLSEVIKESRERNSAHVYNAVRSVTNSAGLVRTDELFANARTSADTGNYKVVGPGAFAYNPSRINVGSLAWNAETEPVIVSPMYVVFEIDSTQIRAPYLDLFLRSSKGRTQIENRVEPGARFRMTFESLSRLKIQIPPLEVQDEIVAALSFFEALDTSLVAELGARRRQYAHYTSSAFQTPGSVRIVDLGSVARVQYGRDFPLSLQGSDSGDYPFFKVSDMTTHGNEVALQVAVNYISSAELASLGTKPAPSGTILIPRVGAAVATNKKRILPGPAAFDTSFLGLVPGPEIHPRYLLYWLSTIDLKTLSNEGGAVPSVRRALLEALQFPLTSLTDQQHIVDELDDFNSLITDVSVGLPAEIAARRRQYGFYRDRLLNFDGAAA